ncbi:MAG: hypothetical protein M3017_12585 [Actinomycetota bacterium]|nr:hypothetical protein [Actinomycetota bacterium]
MTTASPALALLLDVDGPVASPVTRMVRPGIITDLVALAAAGIPIIFNTGRSDTFIREQVMEPMLAAGMPEGMVVHAICEKGAVWFSFTSDGAGPIRVDRSLAVPAAYGEDIRALVAEDYADHMFFDDTKRAMVSVEQRVDISNEDYRDEQRRFDAKALELMTRHGLAVVLLDHHALVGASAGQPSGGQPAQPGDADDAGPAGFRVDPTIISTDIESVRLGKDLGASRAVELLAAQRITPCAWRTVGDSRTDYAMADWLHHNDHEVAHVDVRPADGVPVKPYRILTAADLGLEPDVIHDDAGAAFLRRWLETVTG